MHLLPAAAALGLATTATAAVLKPELANGLDSHALITRADSVHTCASDNLVGAASTTGQTTQAGTDTNNAAEGEISDLAHDQELLDAIDSMLSRGKGGIVFGPNGLATTIDLSPRQVSTGALATATSPEGDGGLVSRAPGPRDDADFLSSLSSSLGSATSTSTHQVTLANPGISSPDEVVLVAEKIVYVNNKPVTTTTDTSSCSKSTFSTSATYLAGMPFWGLAVVTSCDVGPPITSCYPPVLCGFDPQARPTLPAAVPHDVSHDSQAELSDARALMRHYVRDIGESQSVAPTSVVIVGASITTPAASSSRLNERDHDEGSETPSTGIDVVFVNIVETTTTTVTDAPGEVLLEYLLIASNANSLDAPSTGKNTSITGSSGSPSVTATAPSHRMLARGLSWTEKLKDAWQGFQDKKFTDDEEHKFREGATDGAGPLMVSPSSSSSSRSYSQGEYLGHCFFRVASEFDATPSIFKAHETKRATALFKRKDWIADLEYAWRAYAHNYKGREEKDFRHGVLRGARNQQQIPCSLEPCQVGEALGRCLVEADELDHSRSIILPRTPQPSPLRARSLMSPNPILARTAGSAGWSPCGEPDADPTSCSAIPSIPASSTPLPSEDVSLWQGSFLSSGSDIVKGHKAFLANLAPVALVGAGMAAGAALLGLLVGAYHLIKRLRRRNAEDPARRGETRRKITRVFRRRKTVEDANSEISGSQPTVEVTRSTAGAGGASGPNTAGVATEPAPQTVTTVQQV